LPLLDSDQVSFLCDLLVAWYADYLRRVFSSVLAHLLETCPDARARQELIHGMLWYSANRVDAYAVGILQRLVSAVKEDAQRAELCEWIAWQLLKFPGFVENSFIPGLAPICWLAETARYPKMLVLRLVDQVAPCAIYADVFLRLSHIAHPSMTKDAQTLLVKKSIEHCNYSLFDRLVQMWPDCIDETTLQESLEMALDYAYPEMLERTLRHHTRTRARIGLKMSLLLSLRDGAPPHSDFALASMVDISLKHGRVELVDLVPR
jgi:hypothetical protein